METYFIWVTVCISVQGFCKEYTSMKSLPSKDECQKELIFQNDFQNERWGKGFVVRSACYSSKERLANDVTPSARFDLDH